MKSKGSKGNGSIVGSSVRSSLSRYFESSWFMTLSAVLVVLIEVYLSISAVMVFSDVGVVSTNAKMFSSDKSIEKVSYINDEGIVFLENGDSFSDYSVTRVTWGNVFWYSYSENTVGIPMTLGECILEYVVLCLVSVGSLWFCMLMIWVLGKYWVNVLIQAIGGAMIVYGMLCIALFRCEGCSIFENNILAYAVSFIISTLLISGTCFMEVRLLSRRCSANEGEG